MELDNLRAQKRDHDDIIANLERRKDLLFRENEKLKAEWKNSRSSVERSSVGSGAGLKQVGLGLANPLSSSGKSLNVATSKLSQPSLLR
jgi:hypothetical protein